jgi:cell division protein FtsI (penicillin-binding protein 3)
MKHHYKDKLKFKPTSKTVEDSALEMCRNRLVVVFVATCLVFCVLIFRLFEISLSNSEEFRVVRNNVSDSDFFVQRSDITDRNGSIIAVNLSTASLYANTNEIIDFTKSAKELCNALSLSSCKDLTDKLRPGRTFVWVKRHLTPKEQQTINDLGLPGLYFIKEEKRVYPHNNLFSHILGYVDLDNVGISGIEKQFDSYLTNNNMPLALSVDLRIQEVMREELQKQMSLHDALGASGVLLDVNTGEIISLVSLPDFDPNNPTNTKERARFNQVTLGVYEMGSTFKVLTTAMALDGHFIKVNDAFDTRVPVYVGKHRIGDMMHRRGSLSIPEILMYSSNIGTAQIAMKVGIENQKKYIRHFGLTSPLDIELPEKSRPLYPSDKTCTNASLVTISYGHGISVTPLHTAVAFSSVVNGGKLFKPTLLKINKNENAHFDQVLSSETSEIMRKMLRLVVTNGSGKRAHADGYVVAGKTGTSEKIVGNKYSKKANLAMFVGAFPIDEPKYALLVVIDEAKRNELNKGFTTGGMVAAPVVGEVITRIAPILGVKPRNMSDPEFIKNISLIYQARYKPN